MIFTVVSSHYTASDHKFGSESEKQSITAFRRLLLQSTNKHTTLITNFSPRSLQQWARMSNTGVLDETALSCDVV